MSVIAGRKTATFSGPLVVFVIGMRINHFHKVSKWLPVMKAMPPMLAELAKDPGYVLEAVRAGTDRARSVTQETKEEITSALGLFRLDPLALAEAGPALLTA